MKSSWREEPEQARIWAEGCLASVQGCHHPHQPFFHGAISFWGHTFCWELGSDGWLFSLRKQSVSIEGKQFFFFGKSCKQSQHI